METISPWKNSECGQGLSSKPGRGRLWHTAAPAVTPSPRRGRSIKSPSHSVWAGRGSVSFRLAYSSGWSKRGKRKPRPGLGLAGVLHQRERSPASRPRAFKDGRAEALHGNGVQIKFILVGPTRAATHPATPHRPDQKSQQAEATTCRDPGSVDCPGFFLCGGHRGYISARTVSRSHSRGEDGASSHPAVVSTRGCSDPEACRQPSREAG